MKMYKCDECDKLQPCYVYVDAFRNIPSFCVFGLKSSDYNISLATWRKITIKKHISELKEKKNRRTMKEMMEQIKNRKGFTGRIGGVYPFEGNHYRNKK